jgi:hypothetical protein
MRRYAEASRVLYEFLDQQGIDPCLFYATTRDLYRSPLAIHAYLVKYKQQQLLPER